MQAPVKKTPVERKLVRAAREGVVVALSVWWKKLAADRRNANEVTSQSITKYRQGSDVLRLPGRSEVKSAAAA